MLKFNNEKKNKKEIQELSSIIVKMPVSPHEVRRFFDKSMPSTPRSICQVWAPMSGCGAVRCGRHVAALLAVGYQGMVARPSNSERDWSCGAVVMLCRPFGILQCPVHSYRSLA